jgi:hypothetical protein
MLIEVLGLVFIGCPTEDDGGNDDLSWKWSQDEWQSWFYSHSPYDSSDIKAVNTFRVENPLWISNNTWWSEMYTNWMAGSYSSGGGGDSLSTYWSQSEWVSWFNSHPASNTSNVTTVSTFMATNSVWVSSNSWWSTMRATWASGQTVSGGGGGGGGDGDLSTSMTQSEWASWFNSHPATTVSNITTINNFMLANTGWVSSNAWWSTMRGSWAMGQTVSAGGGGGGGEEGGGGGGGDNPFVGTWSSSSGQQLVFSSDSTVNANWMGNGTYTYSGNTATVTFGSASQSLTISGNSFTWSGISFSKK